jgi:ABC-type multidrug transport system fused ATPase/permease subunit
MPTQHSQQTCQAWLAQLAEADIFLGRRDQSLKVAEDLEKSAEELHRVEGDIGSHLNRLLEEVQGDFTHCVKFIEDARTEIQGIFQRLRESPRNAVVNRNATRDLDVQISHLSRRLRLRMLRTLDRLSPKYKVLEKPLTQMVDFRLRAIDPLPDVIWLLHHPKLSADTLAAKTVFELAVAPKLENLCRVPLFSPLRFSWLRWQCLFSYSFTKIPFKALVLDCLVTRSELKPQTLINRHESTHEELQKRLLDAWRGIRYNIETAETELEDLREQLRNEEISNVTEKFSELESLVNSAFEQCLETFDDVYVTYASFVGAVIADIGQDHVNALGVARQAINGYSSFRARLRWRRYAIRRSWQHQGMRLAELTNQKIGALKFSPVSWMASVASSDLFQSLFKRHAQADESLLQLTDLPTQKELLEKAKDLPPIYRRLFQDEPLSNREFLLGMDEEYGLLQATLARWQSGKASSVAVVGPDGSGKTSLINCFENDIPESSKVSRLELQYRMRSVSDVMRMLEDLLGIEEESDSVAELIKKIQALEPQIVIIEGGHQLFIRAIGARQVLDTFIYIMMSTRSKLFWIVAFRFYPWVRMNYIYQIERYFTHVIKSEVHNQSELTSALMVRQRVTGQEPVFSAEGVGVYRIRKLLTHQHAEDAPVQQALADLYFEKLYAQSGGNMSTALFYWLSSLQANTEGDITVTPCFSLDTGFIKRLDTLYLFSLAEVLCHGGLTPAEHSELFNVDMLRSRIILEYLSQIRLLHGLGEDRYEQAVSYTVNPLFYQPISTVLNAMHILY